MVLGATGATGATVAAVASCYTGLSISPVAPHRHTARQALEAAALARMPTA